MNIDWSVFENFDWAIFKFAENLKCGFLDFFFGTISWLGDIALPWFILAIILLFFKKTRKLGFAIASAVLVATLINSIILKDFFARPRPFDYIWSEGRFFNDAFYRPSWLKIPDSLSFPSGHTASAFAPAFVIWFYRKYKAGVPAFIFAFLTGLSRIYVHDHFPTDVIFGIVSGIFCGIITVLIFEGVSKISRKNKCQR